jgi:hypothetical protein
MRLVVNDQFIDVKGLNGWNWKESPKIAPPITDGYRRDENDACAVMWHTSSGRLTTKVRPGSVESTHENRLALYQSRTKREVSWHATVGTDGDIIQQADFELWMCWHAGWTNSWTVGFELAQLDSGPLLAKDEMPEAQIQAAATLTDETVKAMGISKRILVDPSTGKPWLGPVRQLLSKRAAKADGTPLNGLGQTWDGVLAHCHVAHKDSKGGRGPGDPGPLLFEELIRRGYARHPVFKDGIIGGTPI